MTKSEESGWDFTLLVFGTLLCIGVFQSICWLNACWRQRAAEQRNHTTEAQVQTEQDEQQPPAQQRRETNDGLEARIAQYKQFIKSGNEAMDRVRQEKMMLEERCRTLEAEIQVRDERQDRTDERLGEQQRMIAQLEQDLASVSQQAAYLRNHLGGLPQCSPQEPAGNTIWIPSVQH